MISGNQQRLHYFQENENRRSIQGEMIRLLLFQIKGNIRGCEHGFRPIFSFTPPQKRKQCIRLFNLIIILSLYTH